MLDLPCRLTDRLDTTVNNHHKALTTQDSKIESANKKLKAAKASIDRADAHAIEAHKHAADPDSQKFRNDLERATKTRENAGNVYTKAVDVGVDTIGTGSSRVMVLLPSHIANNTK